MPSLMSRVRASYPVRAIAATAAAALALAGFAQVPVAQAAPVPGDPETVTAAGLPTWQINGVVWSQATVGNTVYVTGSFSKARPPGEPVGSAREITASNIFAFDIRTGEPVPFAHSLNAQGLVIRANADGSRIYVGGDFTAVDGVPRAHIAAFDTATGELSSFDARTDGAVYGFGFVGGTVYAGGNFRSSNGQPRGLLAAYDAANGQLSPWAPTAEGGYVWSMVTSPDSSRIIASGSFTTLNGVDAYGMGALDATTGATSPWEANTRIRAAGVNGAVMGLSTDGTSIFGSGYSFGTGAQFEGTFSANPSTGAINWVNDCLGDTYDTFPMGGVLYTVSHDHDCSPIDSFPDTSPRSRWQRVSAERIGPAIGTYTDKDAYGWDFRGLPYTGQLHWYPDLDFGSYTASKQAAWAVTGNSDYIVFGGEFPRVNNVAQQGLVRFGKRPAHRGEKPIYNAAATPLPLPIESGTVKVVLGAMWDRDDAALEYDVYRDNGATSKIAVMSRSDSEFWRLPTYTVTDTGLPPGTQVRYQVRARDAAGNFQWTPWSSYVTVSDTPASAYSAMVAADGASHHWRLGQDAATPVLLDLVGDAHGKNAGQALGAPGALQGEADGAITGAAGGAVTTATPEAAPGAVSVEAWVKTDSVRGGRIVGFGKAATGTSALTDRVLYLDKLGRPNFMIRDTAVRTVAARGAINDNQWHHVVGVVAEDGMQLFVDGVRVARDQRFTTPGTYSGFWRIGSDRTSSFANAPADTGLVGSIDEVAVYPRALSVAEIQEHVTGSGRTGTWSPQPDDAYSQAVLAQSPDLFWRLGDPAGPAADSSGNGATGTFAGTVTRGTVGALEADPAATFDGSSGVVVADQGWTSPGPFTTELWFKTRSTRGGKLVGLGNTTSGLSGTYDRHVYMYSNGKLSFGVNSTAGKQSIVSGTSYNDDQWHHLVATMGADGMKLWVDSVLVGSNPTTSGTAYVGYWRVGGDRTWGSTASNFIAGSLDEVAVYPTALNEDAVRAHYEAAGRTSANRRPVAAFQATTATLTATVDGSESTDPDGPIASWQWDFGDGATGTGANASHTFAQAGTYTVTLTVTDGQGVSATTSKPVTVAADQAPTAAFTWSSQNRTVILDADGSTDTDGKVTGFAWDFGDGATGSGQQVQHTYAQAGTYTATLTVTDNAGQTNAVSRQVVAVDPPNQAPTAAFTSSVVNLVASFDGSASTDPEGGALTHSWDFGDGQTATGATVQHTYAQPGTYHVVLTVNDPAGATNSKSADVVVISTTVVAADAFERATSGGWGAADTGGAWTIKFGASRFSTANGHGRMELAAAGSGYSAVLSSVSTTSADVAVDVVIDQAATGGGNYFTTLGRVVGNNSYALKTRVLSTGGVAVHLVKTVGGVETVLSSRTLQGMTYAPGETLKVRLQVTGTAGSELKSKVWKGGDEPAAWDLTATDATGALQAAGGVGLAAYVAGSSTNVPIVYTFDNLTVTAP